MDRKLFIFLMVFSILCLAIVSAITINPNIPLISPIPDTITFTSPVVANNNVNVNQGVSISTTSAQPSCTSANRGQFWVVQGTLGVADVLYVCRKSALDVYGWGVVTLS